jgi:hypothetical protein
VGRTPEIDEIEEETLNGLDIAGLGRWVVGSLDGSDTMEEDTPLSSADQSQGDDDVELLVPNGNCPVVRKTCQTDPTSKNSEISAR